MLQPTTSPSSWCKCTGEAVGIDSLRAVLANVPQQLSCFHFVSGNTDAEGGHLSLADVQQHTCPDTNDLKNIFVISGLHDPRTDRQSVLLQDKWKLQRSQHLLWCIVTLLRGIVLLMQNWIRNSPGNISLEALSNMLLQIYMTQCIFTLAVYFLLIFYLRGNLISS